MHDADDIVKALDRFDQPLNAGFVDVPLQAHALREIRDIQLDDVLEIRVFCFLKLAQDDRIKDAQHAEVNGLDALFCDHVLQLDLRNRLNIVSLEIHSAAGEFQTVRGSQRLHIGIARRCQGHDVLIIFHGRDGKILRDIQHRVPCPAACSVGIFILRLHQEILHQALKVERRKKCEHIRRGIRKQRFKCIVCICCLRAHVGGILFREALRKCRAFVRRIKPRDERAELPQIHHMIDACKRKFR